MTRILVVEDEAEIREEIVDMLLLDKYDVLQAADGDKAATLAREELPDLIDEGRMLLRNTNEITERISNHWLLGGSAKESGIRPLPGLHPHDQEAYETTETGNTEATGECAACEATD